MTAKQFPQAKAISVASGYRAHSGKRFRALNDYERRASQFACSRMRLGGYRRSTDVTTNHQRLLELPYPNTPSYRHSRAHHMYRGDCYTQRSGHTRADSASV